VIPREGVERIYVEVFGGAAALLFVIPREGVERNNGPIFILRFAYYISDPERGS